MCQMSISLVHVYHVFSARVLKCQTCYTYMCLHVCSMYSCSMYTYCTYILHGHDFELYPLVSGGSPSPLSYAIPMPTSTTDDSSRPSSASRHSMTTPTGSTHSYTTNDMAERHSLERLLRSILERLARHMSAVTDLTQQGDLSLLFGAISRPCPGYNKMWRKTAADCLIAICRLVCVVIN